MNYTIAQRQQRAEQLHAQGYNCAQCVMMVFDDVTGLDDEVVAKMLAGFGGGMGAHQEACGTLSAAVAMQGVTGFASPADKMEVYKTTTAFIEKFEQRYGATRCCDLKRIGKPCLQLIKEVVEMVARDIVNTPE